MSATFRLDRENLRELIQERAEFCQVVTIRAETIPDMRKTNNPFWGKVLKDSKVNGFIRWNYSSSVNRQRLREALEPDFQAKPRKWGERLENSPFVFYKGKYYIELKPEKRLTEIYRDIVTHEEIPKESLADFLKKPYDPSEYQGVEKGVYLRDFYLGNIREIRIGGDLFIVESTENEAFQLQNSAGS